MKILSVKELAIPDVKSITFARFGDDRGYFTETYRKNDFSEHSGIDFLDGAIEQINESHSQENVLRGLHLQWDPYMGKLVRTVRGHMIDFVLDLRKGSPTAGKIVALDMPSHPNDETDTWIWVPVGFAHGNLFLEETTIEYYCTGHWNPNGEASISPLSEDIDWSLCDNNIEETFKQYKDIAIVSEKDQQGLSVGEWMQSESSDKFQYDA